MNQVDTGKIVLITSLVAAFAAILAAGLTGWVQVVVAGRQAKGAALAAEAERRAAHNLREADRKRDLYLRWLRWLTNIEADMEDALPDINALNSGPGTWRSKLAHASADFRAELLLYASTEVRDKSQHHG